ncbi:uncharacterized protein LOC124158618 [Ischnura elegans]|uniref:uncharacterized protein LOC124158618 n=1 Tax=Ischnura elegans TaxID=197161 RepID=UPI001ED890E6|nr:uncharacterized protein LOC124158618 [Ischnura elegans]
MAAPIREDDCKTAVQNLLGTEDFVLEGLTVRGVGDGNAAGFMGRHCKLTVAVRVGGELRELRFFAKLPPATKSHRAFVIDAKLFHRECVAYTCLAPMMNDALPHNLSIPYPRCYFSRDTVNPEITPVPGSAEEEIIILEDVSFRGCEFREGFPTMDLHHCRVVMRSLARLHAASILYEHRRRPSPDESLGPRSFLDDLWKPGIARSYAQSCSRTVATASACLWPEEFGNGRDAEVFSAMVKAWDLLFDAGTAFPQYSNIMCHGDTWTNNILFSYEETEGGCKVPVDCVFVDLQIVQYVPPVTDILVFLHIGTRREFRERHTKSLLELYHKTLGEYVGTDLLERVLPFSALLQSHADLRAIGLIIPAAYLPVIFEDMVKGGEKSGEPMDIDEAILKDRGETIASNCKLSQAYGERIMECFRECLEGLGLW